MIFFFSTESWDSLSFSVETLSTKNLPNDRGGAAPNCSIFLGGRGKPVNLRLLAKSLSGSG